MKYLILALFISMPARAATILSQNAVIGMNLIRSEQVAQCLDELDSRHPGVFTLQKVRITGTGTNTIYHMYGFFLEGGDMAHGSAHVDVKIGLAPPRGPGYQCHVVSESE